MTGFANDLRFCREAAGLSLSAAAKAAGITKAHLHDMESGRARNPGVSTLAGLARAYGQNVGWMAERAALALSGEVQPVGSERSDDERSVHAAPTPSPETPESGDGWEGETIPRAAAVEACSEWLRQFGDTEITFTSARQHASDAVMDIRDHIRAIPASAGGFPAKAEWLAIIDRIVPAMAPMSDAAANRYPAEWMLWRDRERIRAELAALPPPPETTTQGSEQ